jgi:long-chain acyl-CoA synthetase
MREDTIPTLFQSQVKKYGDRTALRKKEYGVWIDISWREYGEKVKYLCLGLISLGLQKGECVSIIGGNRPEWLFADLGIMSAGGVTVGIYTTNSVPQCEYIVNHSESRFYIVEDEEQLDKALAFRKNTPRLEKIIVMDMKGLKHFQDPMVMRFEDLLERGKILDQQRPHWFETRVQEGKPDDLAVLIYTSGTTGPPKGAMLSHHNVIWTTGAIQSVVPIREQDEVLSFLPLCHIAERLFSVFAAIRYGYIVNFVEEADTVAQNLQEISPTIFFAVPRIWEKYYSLITLKMNQADWIKRQIYRVSLWIGKNYVKAEKKSTKGHEGLQIKILRGPSRPFVDSLLKGLLRCGYALAYLAVFRKLKERLGFDRVHHAVSGAAPISPEVLNYFHSIGIPLREGYGQTEGTGVTTVHPPDQIKIGTVGKPIPGIEVKIAEDGEILVKGPNVFQGYYKNLQATSETLQDGWLHSGDVGMLDEEGFLIILDRKKDLIITAAGKNIAPQNIENQLKFSFYIQDAIVIGDRRKYLTALIVIDEDNVIQYAQEQKIQFTTYANLSQHPDIQKLVQQEVDKVNKTLAQVETIKKFTILSKKLYEEDGEMTPTMKVKRKHIQEAFREIIEAMY